MELNVSEFVNESRHEIITIKQNKTGIGHTYYSYTVHTDKWQGENVPTWHGHKRLAIHLSFH